MRSALLILALLAITASAGAHDPKEFYASARAIYPSLDACMRIEGRSDHSFPCQVRRAEDEAMLDLWEFDSSRRVWISGLTDEERPIPGAEPSD